MDNKIMINTEKAPKAIGPYSQAIRIDRTVYISGQIPIDPTVGEIVGEDIEKQTKQVMENIKAVIQEAGGSLDHIVKTTIFLDDLSNFTIVNEVYGQYFKQPYPARACVEVSRLPKNVKVEIEARAYI